MPKHLTTHDAGNLQYTARLSKVYAEELFRDSAPCPIQMSFNSNQKPEDLRTSDMAYICPHHMGVVPSWASRLITNHPASFRVQCPRHGGAAHPARPAKVPSVT